VLDDKTGADKPRARKGRLFRERFIATCAEHMTDAAALGRRPPHPWFIEYCLRYLVDDEAPPDPTPD
jgi:hypothetical protein